MGLFIANNEKKCSALRVEKSDKKFVEHYTVFRYKKFTYFFLFKKQPQSTIKLKKLKM